MNNYNNILNKLNAFYRKYYGVLLVKGLLLFFILGVLIFLGILTVEYFLWLPTTGRLVLFVVALATEAYLLIYFIVRPLVYLFRLRKGIDNKKASQLIGRHFTEVGDKLYNLLDLCEDPKKSELLLASIDQRSRELSPVPFSRAVNHSEAKRYLKYTLIPLGIILAIVLSGNIADFLGSYRRVVHFETAFNPPAPFEFIAMMGELKVLENESFTVQVGTRGKVKPEAIFINIDGSNFELQESGDTYTYTFRPPLESVDFYFSANGIKSRQYHLEAVRVPSLEDFEMALNYPAYLQRLPERINSTGNAVIPEGTTVLWNVHARNTDQVQLKTIDTIRNFEQEEDIFSLNRQIFKDMDYEISTSNDFVTDFEVLKFRFTVIEDAFPVIKVKENIDSLAPENNYFEGEVSDDHGLVDVSLVVYPAGDEQGRQILNLIKPDGNYEEFFYRFPDMLNLERGKDYEFYFMAKDNDAIHGGKIGRSRIFRVRVLNENEIKRNNLESQQQLMKGLDKSLKNYSKDEEQYRSIEKLQKEKSQLNFRDQTEVRDFLDKQKQQEEMMQRFSRELKENLSTQNDNNKLNKLLQERLERREQEARKNAALLEELNKLADKIDKDELSKRLEELGKQRQSNKRSLEQILELTKRYYVSEKVAQLARDLEKLAERQKDLAGNEINWNNENLQDSLNKDFNESSGELDELRKDNKGLNKPFDINVDREDQEAVERDQQQALEELRKQNGSEDNERNNKDKNQGSQEIRKRQIRASEKLEEMAKKLEMSTSDAAEGSSIAEDAEMLRQILDNLITFSFKQERLFEKIEEENFDLSNFSGQVRDQQELRDLFGHIDDSLFALSLRRAEIADLVNEEITEVYYNIDKTLESFADNRIYQGVSHQQYVFTAANTLADFLASLLDNMQESLAMGSGNGSQGQGFQLPDIIKSQGELKEKMGKMGDSGSQGSQGKGTSGNENPGEGDNGKEGKDAGQGEGRGNENGEGRSTRSGEPGNSGTNGLGEEQLNELYEIFKEQQQIRMELEKQLKDLLQDKDKELANKLLRQMEDFENDLLENGITRQTMLKVNVIEHELLKLENATLKQGEKRERESTTNNELFRNTVIYRPENLDDFQNELENLNRQALPLRPVYQDKVKDYFKSDD